MPSTFCRSFLIGLCFLLPTRFVQAAGFNFSYTLPGPGKTSAGVYTSTSPVTLIRTLWSGNSQGAGAQTASWDGKLDDGTPAPAGNYAVKILYSNVQYTWLGVIGNTSSAFTTTTANLWRSMDGFHDMAFSAADTTAFAAMGYGEGLSTVYSFDISDPQTPSAFISAANSQFPNWTYVATDGARVYVANTGGTDNDQFSWDSNNSCFVFSYAMDGTAASFAQGQNVTTSDMRVYRGAIDVYQEIGSPAAHDPAFTAAHRATGLAVQQTGNVLAVSHGGLDRVALYDKTTGALLGNISLSHPGRIAFAPNGDLWVIVGTSVERFAGANLGATSTPATMVAGFASPLVLGVDPQTSNVLVADGDVSQQVKAYSRTGTSQWTLGVAGGYNTANGPDVQPNKFQFVVGRNSFPLTFLAVESDGSFWIGDGGNRRVEHFSSSRTYLGQISSLGTSYRATVDPNNPARIFALGWLQYQLDYSKTLSPGDPDPASGGNGSWKLVKNWSAGVSQDPVTGYEGFITVVSMTSGNSTRTYSLLMPMDNSQDYAVAELPANGPLRFAYAGTTTPADRGMWLAPSGDLRYSTVAGGTETIYAKTFTGFDGSGNPLWNAPTVLATVPVGNGTPDNGNGHRGWAPPVTTFPVTANNTVISFNAGQGTVSYPDYHLGGIPVGGTAWQFKTSKAADLLSPDGKGTYPTQASYGGHNGNDAWAVGRHILWNYDGQYGTFAAAQAYSNQFAHYYEDGLFIGQFGTSWEPSHEFNAAAGYSGNYGQAIMVQGPDGNLYVFSADESVHSGVHVWRMSGLNTVQEITATIIGSASACDINHDGAVNVSDVQLEVNMALGLAACTSLSGQCTVTQVQRVVNAVSGSCIAP